MGPSCIGYQLPQWGMFFFFSEEVKEWGGGAETLIEGEKRKGVREKGYLKCGRVYRNRNGCNAFYLF